MKSAHSESKYQISPPLLASLFCVSLSSEPPQQVKDEGQPILHQGNHYQNVPLTLDPSGAGVVNGIGITNFNSGFHLP